MNDARKKMLDKIRAMMNTEGRTEAEMMAFLAKARELMATYEIDEKELEEQAEKATIFKTAPSDPYDIKTGLSVSVGKFASCVAFRNSDGIVCFAGKESDAIFATWLLDTLQRFVMRALRQYQTDRARKHLGNTNHTSASFVVGCASRINEKLKEHTPINWSKSKALILKELNMTLGRGGAFGKNADPNAAAMGAKAGNSARFDRPVGQGGQLRLK